MTRSIGAEALHAALVGGDELAFIDVREQGLFGRRHPLLAVNIPLSRFELEIRDLVPRRTTPIVLCDEDDGLAERAARLLDAAGYTEVAILDGGVEGWGAEGYELFSGVNVPSKAFGEYVEHRYGTPSIDAKELKAKLEAGEKIVILDSRPMEEYRNMNIPGGINTPGAELVYRIRDLAPDPDTLVVVNCAGRTRSIIGCQSLRNAGVPNPVVALRNGTMGWHLAGFELERGARRQCGPVSDQALAWAREAAARVGARFGVRRVDRATLAAWQAESEKRTLYLLDVRFPEEFEAGHLPGSRPAPGGQLVQATDRYMATRNARVVLVDDTEVRATMTASWLVQMGWPEVYVLEGGLGEHDLAQGAYNPSVPELDGLALARVAPRELREELDEGRAAVVDFADSISYREAHVPGAFWAIRSRLERIRDRLPPAQRYAVTAPEDALARLAARDLAALTNAPVAVLDGGTAAWREAGLPLEEGMSHALDEPVDCYYRPYDQTSGAEEAMNRYLEWEIALIHQIERDGTLRFPEFPS